jgi:hypothetical protein
MAKGLWYPDNLVERELAGALAGAGFARYFRVFLQAQLWVPVVAVSGEQDERWDQVTREVLGESVVPVFTIVYVRRCASRGVACGAGAGAV